MDRERPAVQLFPYTTLFRSAGPTARSAIGQRVTLQDEALPAAGEVEGQRTTSRPRGRAVAKVSSGKAERPARCQDRNGTRLNSSHTVISYAVLCFDKHGGAI